MIRVEVYRANNGQLENDLDRAKAHDIEFAIKQAFGRENRSAASRLEPKINWSVAMEILKYADLIKANLDEFIEARDAAAAEEQRRKRYGEPKRGKYVPPDGLEEEEPAIPGEHRVVLDALDPPDDDDELN